MKNLVPLAGLDGNPTLYINPDNVCVVHEDKTHRTTARGVIINFAGAHRIVTSEPIAQVVDKINKAAGP